MQTHPCLLEDNCNALMFLFFRLKYILTKISSQFQSVQEIRMAEGGRSTRNGILNDSGGCPAGFVFSTYFHSICDNVRW